MKEQNARAVEERMLDATFLYLAQNGLENFSIRDLCKATGISMGSVYYWFNGKDELILNCVKRGFANVSTSICEYVFENLDDLKYFFDTCIDEISKYKMELRFIYQVATSPIYGPMVRKDAEPLNDIYVKYSEKLASIVNRPTEEIYPLVYLTVTTVLDYIVWEDIEVTKMQFDYIYNLLTDPCANNQRERNNQIYEVKL